MKLILPKAAAYVMTNLQLNASDDFKGKRCHKCGRSYPSVVLNVQDVILNGDELRCVNRENCEKCRKQTRGGKTQAG